MTNSENTDSIISCSQESNHSLQLFPIRIIPVDLGYKIDSKRQQRIFDKMVSSNFLVSTNIKLFGEDAILKIECSENLDFYIFADGIGVFSYCDSCTNYVDASNLDAEIILNQRKNTHRNILQHTHSISQSIERVTSLIRALVPIKNRRITSYENWENGGLSYVMSFYMVNANCSLLDDTVVQEWLGNLLFTDKHNYFGVANDSFKQEKKEQILNNIDVLNNIHVCHSWATMIALGELPENHRQYYINLEIVLQHIWMFAYITEQNIDSFLAESNKKISSKQLTRFYDSLIDMTLIVKKYDTVISSTVHEREFKIFEELKESSKLEILKKGIDEKSDILERKLSWALSQKRLKSDRNTELFITILTILQVVSGFGIGISDFTNPLVLYSILASLIIFAIFRLRD